MATAAIDRGVFAVTTWGPGCELVHDLVDWAVVGMEVDDPDAGAVGTVMTTWHADEPLSEVLEHFVTSSRASSDRPEGRLRLVLRDQRADTADLPGWFAAHGLTTRQLDLCRRRPRPAHGRRAVGSCRTPATAGCSVLGAGVLPGWSTPGLRPPRASIAS